MGRRTLAAFVSFSLVVSPAIGGEWKPPPVASSWEAYEMAYPRKTVSGAALELERLAARLGIDAAPRGETVTETVDGEERQRQLVPKDGRDRPDPQLAERVQPTIAAIGGWVDQELSQPSDQIGSPPKAVARFYEENAATLDALVAVTAGPRPIEWDLDMALRSEAPLPNLLGLQRLQRVLAGRALLQIRAGDSAPALETLEGMWRLVASLAEQPFLISHLIAVSQMRLIVGLLRKVEVPAFGWEERLRSRAYYEAFLAAFQNDPWPALKDRAGDPDVQTLFRVYRRFVDSLEDKSPCDWTREDLSLSWDVAESGEAASDEIIETVAWDSITDMLRRWQRLLIDSDMTAMVLQARADKAASREGEWPARLINLESSVCHGRFYTYRRAAGVTIALEGTVPPVDSPALVLPLTFRGAPPPTPTPTPTGTPALTPTPTPHTLAPK
jgi:hypothetical protein